MSKVSVDKFGNLTTNVLADEGRVMRGQGDAAHPRTPLNKHKRGQFNNPGNYPGAGKFPGTKGGR